MNIELSVQSGAGRLAASALPSAAWSHELDEMLRSLLSAAAAKDHAIIRQGGASDRAAVVLSSPALDADEDRAGIVRFAAQFSKSAESLSRPIISADGGSSIPFADRVDWPGEIAALFDGDAFVALPVRLGMLGNGTFLFSTDLDRLRSVDVIALHRKTHCLFKLLLTADIRRKAPRQNLNDRELECLQLAGEGLKSELIAERLSLSVHTVNAYLGTATAKLDSVNRIQAIAKALRLGYLA